jgi:hypothetical protein
MQALHEVWSGHATVALERGGGGGRDSMAQIQALRVQSGPRQVRLLSLVVSPGVDVVVQGGAGGQQQWQPNQTSAN